MSIVNLGSRRPPVIYTVTIAERWDGGLSVQVNDVQDDPRSRFAVADALSRGSALIKERCREEHSR